MPRLFVALSIPLLRFPKAKQHFQKVEPDSGSDFKRKELRNVHFQKTELKAVQESDMKAWKGGLGRFQRSLFQFICATATRGGPLGKCRYNSFG
jgi:predicted acetyltransferase